MPFSQLNVSAEDTDVYQDYAQDRGNLRFVAQIVSAAVGTVLLVSAAKCQRQYGDRESVPALATEARR